MQLMIPTRFQIHLAFDQLLTVIYPQLFPAKIEQMEWDSPGSINYWRLVHENIDKYLPIVPITTVSAIEKNAVFIRIRIFLTDFEKEQTVDIPCQFKFLNERISVNEPITITQLVSFIQSPQIPFNPDQLMKILELHLAVEKLIAEFEREQKHGKLFFHSTQSLELLHTYIPTCSPNQAMRFFYWGILKFSCDRDLDTWLYEENFREFLDKLHD